MVSISKKIKIILIIAFLLIFQHQFSYAAGLVPCGGPEERPCKVCDLLVLAQNVIKFILTASFIVCIVFIVYGGFIWLLSVGKSENIARGQKTIISALVGLLIVLSAWLIINTILWLLAPKIEGIDIKSTWYKLECY